MCITSLSCVKIYLCFELKMFCNADRSIDEVFVLTVHHLTLDAGCGTK